MQHKTSHNKSHNQKKQTQTLTQKTIWDVLSTGLGHTLCSIWLWCFQGSKRTATQADAGRPHRFARSKSYTSTLSRPTCPDTGAKTDGWADTTRCRGRVASDMGWYREKNVRNSTPVAAAILADVWLTLSRLE